jgi:hypothetical protein
MAGRPILHLVQQARPEDLTATQNRYLAMGLGGIEAAPFFKDRHDLAHHAGALAAAEHEEPERRVRIEGRIGRLGHGQHCRADRVAGMDAARGRLLGYAAHLLETGGDDARALGEETARAVRRLNPAAVVGFGGYPTATTAAGLSRRTARAA